MRAPSVAWLAPALVALAALAPLVALAPAEAAAQCGASVSECRSCHEVRGARPVLVEPVAAWHRDHAFGDFCAVCHGGDPQSKDVGDAHAGLLAPLADPAVSCGSCHGADASLYAKRYEAAARAPAGAPARPAIAESARPPARIAWRNAGLAGVVFLLGGVGAAYVTTNERRIRAAASRTKGAP